MKKWLFSIITLTMLFTTACFNKKSVDPPIPTPTTKTTITVSGSLSNSNGNIISRGIVTGNVEGYTYIIALPLNGGDAVKTKIINNAFSMELSPEKKYVFYFLNQYGIKVNELAFGTQGSAAKIEIDIALGTITPVGDSGIMTVDDNKITTIQDNIETKEEVKTAGEFDPELIKEELKETIKETLIETGKGTVTDDKIIINATSDSDVTNRIEITIDETDSSSDDTIAFDKVEIVQEQNGLLSTLDIPLGDDLDIALESVNAVVDEVIDIFNTSTTLASIQDEIDAVVPDSINVPVVVTEAFTFSLSDQDKFRAYVEKLKTTYAEYYGNYTTTIDKNNMKLIRITIKEHDDVSLGTVITEEIIKEIETYQYKKNNEIVTTGSTVATVIPSTLVTLSPKIIFNQEAINAFTTYVNALKNDYTEFYGSFTQEITAYKLTVSRICLKAHDDIAKGAKVVEEITKTGATSYTYKKIVGITESTSTGTTVAGLIPSTPALVANNVFLNSEITAFNTLYTNMQSNYSGFYGSYSKVATENELSITRTALKTHTYRGKSITNGQQVIEKIIKLNKKYTYTLSVGGQIVSTLENLIFENVIPSIESLDEIIPYSEWNLTKTDFNSYNPNSLSELYGALSSLKAKSNSPAMNYLFQAILETKTLDESLRQEIVTGLNGYIPVGADYRTYNYAEYVFNTPVEVYDLVTKYGLATLDRIADNLEYAYKRNETVKLSETNLTDGYIVEITPAHFKAMSGAFKVYLAQITLLSSYKFESNEDFIAFYDFVDDLTNTHTLDIDFLRNTFQGLGILNADTILQAKALAYMQEGMSELTSALSEMPVIDTGILLADQNVLRIKSEDKVELANEFGKVNGLLAGTGGIGIPDSTGKIIWVRVNLSKLYTLDIKAIVAELLTGTEYLYGDTAKLKIEENIDKSNFGGLLPDGIPEALK